MCPPPALLPPLPPRALAQAASLRSADRRSTFLRTLAAVRQPACELGAELAAQLPSLFEPRARAASTAELRAHAAGCRAALSVIRQELALVPVCDVESQIERALLGTLDTHSRFKHTMGDFAEGAATELERLDDDLAALDKAQRALADFAGEDAEATGAEVVVDELLALVARAVEHLLGA